MLRLGGGEAVTRNDDHLGRVRQLDCCVVCCYRLDVTCRPSHSSCGVASAEAADDDVADRPVHRVCHQLGQDATGGADKRTGDDHRPVADHKTSHRNCGAGECVQQRDNHWHVSAADWHDHRNTEDERGDYDDHQ